jgi:hypothetical protein
MPSSRSTSSRHCFMAPDEAVELGGWLSNFLAADNAPGAALDRVRDVCAVVCCRAACTAAVPDTGRLGTCAWKKQLLPSTTKSTEVSVRYSTICTIMLSENDGISHVWRTVRSPHSISAAGQQQRSSF